MEPSQFQSGPPISGEMEDKDGFTRELVQAAWRVNDPIYLYIVRPKSVTKPPTILYLYSYPSDIDRFRNDDLCRILVKNNFAAVGFVSALTGHRYHDHPLREWFISELQEALVTSVHDVQLILNYLGTRSDLDMDRAGMFGEGSGATIAILASAVDGRLKAIDLFAPWGDWPVWLAQSPVVPDDERAGFVKAEFLKRVEFVDPVEWFPRLKARAIRLHFASDQWGTPKAAQERMKSAAPLRSKIISYADVKAARQNSSSLLDWIKGELAPATKSVSGARQGLLFRQHRAVAM